LVRSSLSRRLDRLEEEGWVQRTRPSGIDDQRAVVVELTRRGRTLWREMNVTYRRAVQTNVAASLSDADVAALRRVLALVTPAVGAERVFKRANDRRGEPSESSSEQTI